MDGLIEFTGMHNVEDNPRTAKSTSRKVRKYRRRPATQNSHLGSKSKRPSIPKDGNARRPHRARLGWGSLGTTDVEKKNNRTYLLCWSTGVDTV